MTNLNKTTMHHDPFEQFARWYADAKTIDKIQYRAAVSVATVDETGLPNNRMVLLKGFDQRGFVFYTNYNSRKGRELQQNPYAALLFYWSWLNRQVRIRGAVVKVSAKEADSYFRSRPRGSQLGAWASMQSEQLENRRILERRVRNFETKYANSEVPRPPHWSGFRIIPDEFEFWQEQPDRLHDRFVYSRTNGKQWTVTRRYP